MKEYIFTFCFFLSFQPIVHCQSTDSDLPSPDKYKQVEEPVQLAQILIQDTKSHWSPTGLFLIEQVYGNISKIVMNGGAYLLMESIDLSYDLIKGGLVKVAGNVSTDLIFELLEASVESPKVLCKSIASATIHEGLTDYRSAFRIANNYLKTGQLSTTDAIEFLDKRWGLFKLASARVLWNASYHYDMDNSTKNKVLSEGMSLFDDNVAEVPVLDFVQLFNRYYHIMESTRAGLPAYQPYIEFKKNMDEINQLRLDEKGKWKTSIEILYPNGSSGWNLDHDKVEIKWKSKVLDENDIISMQLMQNGVKFRDLGSFKNTGVYSIDSYHISNITDGEYYLYAYVHNKTNPSGKIISTKSERFYIGGKKRIKFINNGTNWFIGSKEIVEWNSNFSGRVDFKLDGTNISINDIANKQGFNRTHLDIPHNLQAGVYMLSSYADGQYTGALTISIVEGNDQNTTVNPDNMDGRVITPGPNATNEKGKPIHISWDFSTEGSIIIELYKNDTKIKTLGFVPNNKTSCDYFEIPSYLSSGDAYKIKLTDSKNKGNSINSGYFRIIDERTITSYSHQEQENQSMPRRTSFAGREIKYIANISFNSSRLTIRAYDHGQQDGDIISLYLNGKPVLQEHQLTNRKQTFTVYLEQDETNDLFLFAINEGDIPPNTVALEISDGTKTEPIVLNSNMMSCEGILLHVK